MTTPPPSDGERLLVAAVQMCSGGEVEANLDKAEELCQQAVSRGAQLVALPENFASMATVRDRIPQAEPLGGRIVARMARLAREADIHLILGSIPEQSPEPDRIYNTSVLIGPQGEVLASYRKIHLFDVDLPSGEQYRESSYIVPGRETIVAATAIASVGLSVCYDLRFPEVYRELIDGGAELLSVPAAFTFETGRDHWQVLLRARAIENTAFVIAPAQTGLHPGGRRTYGRSQIIDPWGTVLAQAADKETVVVAELDFAELRRVRQSIPCLRHRQFRVQSTMPIEENTDANA